MNWEQQTYGFGYPNAPPLTPNKTPTAATFPSPSPTLRTPQNNPNNFDLHSGWTPNFAEEYSVFNSTPGHLVDTQRPILDAQGQQILNQHPLSASEETFPSNFQSQFQQDSPNPKLPLPPVALSRRLSSSPRPPVNQSSDLPHNQSPSGVGKVPQQITPSKPRGRLEESGSAQTATPPNTASRGVRRLAAKPTLAPSSMSQSQGFGHGSMQHNGAPLLDFSNTSMDMFGYPMSAPATAPGYSDGKSFWAPDSNMTGMDMDFGDAHHGAVDTSTHKHSNSLDWSRSNEMFQNSANHAAFDMTANRHSSIAHAETQAKGLNFDDMNGHRTYESEHSRRKGIAFSSPARTGVVDPGLLLSYPVSGSDFPSIQAPLDRGKSEVVVRQPYQHQLRESRREQEEELRRSRPSSGASFHSRDARPFSSPTRANSRASLHRSSSTSSSMKLQSQSQRSMERTSRSRERRSSPIKKGNRTSLSSIPEASRFKSNNEPPTRTDITFTIDANGRARTEATVVVSSDHQAPKRSASSAKASHWDESPLESSSDDEIIIVPSRNTSFNLPEAGRRNSSNTLQRSRSERNYSKRGRGSSIYSSSGGEQSYRGGPNIANFESNQDPESEAETVVDQGDVGERSGDATSALRKVWEDRKRRTSRVAMADVTPTRPRRAAAGRNARYGGGSLWEASNTATPSSMADGDVDTPSTGRSEVTRCVCGGFDGDGGFMIQCESCSKWLHAHCVGIDRRNVPHVFICTFCTFTPSARGRLRDGGRGAARTAADFPSSPLNRKSFR